MTDNVLYIFEDTLYRKLQHSLTYQMIFEIANNMSSFWKRKYHFLPEKTLKKFAEKASILIQDSLQGQVLFKFDHKKATEIYNKLFMNRELESICASEILS